MVKFNTKGPAAPVSGPMRAANLGAVTKTAARVARDRAMPVADTRTHLGGPAYNLDDRSALFTLGTTNMVSEDTFHETAEVRDTRFSALVEKLAVTDGAWLADFLRWLRTDGNMRDAPMVAVAHAVRARLAAGDLDDGVTNRALVTSVLQRADEPGKLFDYWGSHWGGTRVDPKTGRTRNAPRVPISVKRGIADALPKLYTEYSAFKYDTASHGVRFGDIVDIVRPDDGRGEFYTWLLDRRHGRDGKDYPGLPMVTARRVLESCKDETERRMFLREVGKGDTAAADALTAAGVTWEWLASWLGGPLDATFWEAVIPNMGYMGLLRNLANFDKTGVSKAVADGVAERLADPDQVAKSRQFPFRFLSAHLADIGPRWAVPLDEALKHSTRNIPQLDGTTLVLIDTSASMGHTISAKSTMTGVQAAALFGVAIAQRGASVNLVGFASGVFTHAVKMRAGTLAEVERFTNRVGEVGHGTMLGEALRVAYQGQRRVVIISDMQTTGRGYDRFGVNTFVPADIPVYAFDTTGYGNTPIAAGTGNRHQLGGLTDATFRMIPLIESGRQGLWPWETPVG
jgi:hypothetical protein